MDGQVRDCYDEWSAQALEDEDLVKELADIRHDEGQIQDCFYCDLEFGTGGLRGVIGVGTNRMNIYTVGKATQGYSGYLKLKCETPTVAIAYDSRIKSEQFAKRAAEVFAANGARVYLYRELMPTPALSFAVRYLHCDGGVVITASHNPAKYNGYKVYGPDGCQITTETAGQILGQIHGVDMFAGVKSAVFEEELAKGTIRYIPEQVVAAYLGAVSAQSLCPDGVDKDVSIVYTPLNGAGLSCVLRVLKENGFTNIAVVKEQEQRDGRFPTCPYPNPEVKEALELGLRDAAKLGSELLLATDPDCDRVGIAVKSGDGYALLSGNEVGMLLLNYICERRTELGTMPESPILIKTIVTADMAKRIAADHGAQTVEVLTGFKFIGEQIGLLEEKGEEGRYIFGFEESYGYLSGTYVRDKDAVNGALMICEMFVYYKARGLGLPEVLGQLYQKYGYCLNTLHSYVFEGADGFAKMRRIMGHLRDCPPIRLADKKILEMKDYRNGLEGLPKAEVIKLVLEGGASMVIRPSGTEPKMKLYVSVSAADEGQAMRLERALVESMSKRIDER